MIAEEVWQEHIDADKRQDEKIRSLHMAVFGCQSRPETVKQAIVPTMARINVWLDVIKVGGQVIVSGSVILGALATVAKMTGML